MVRLQNVDNKQYLHSNIFGKVSLVKQDTGSAQNWIIELAEGEGKWFYLRNEATNLYLDNPVKRNDKIYTNLLYFKNQAQQWTFEGLRVINRATGLALSVDPQSRTNSSKPSDDDKLQLWLHF
jgi:hypothetical protein